MKRKHWIIIDKLVPIILDNVEGCVVDIGIGMSTEVLYQHTEKLQRKHFSCDKAKKFCDWAKEKFPNIEVFQGESLDFIKQFPNLSIAVVFIDGDHHYPTVIEEVNFFLSKLSPGGVIFIHDTLPTKWYHIYGVEDKRGRHKDLTCDSYLVRQELEQRKNLMTFSWPYTAGNYGLTMIMEKEKNVPRFRQ